VSVVKAFEAVGYVDCRLLPTLNLWQPSVRSPHNKPMHMLRTKHVATSSSALSVCKRIGAANCCWFLLLVFKTVQAVRSITVTGHSLGGALASLCSYDLSTTVGEALAAEEDPIKSKEYAAIKVGWAYNRR
jgi:hypothetical protein